MTINELLALTGLTGSDEIPVWDAEASGEPTKKITAQNFAAAIKTLASLLGTGDVVNDLTSGGATVPLSADMGIALKVKQLEFTLDSSADSTSVSYPDGTSKNNMYVVGFLYYRNSAWYYAQNSAVIVLSSSNITVALNVDYSYIKGLTAKILYFKY